MVRERRACTQMSFEVEFAYVNNAFFCCCFFVFTHAVIFKPIDKYSVPNQ